MLRDYPVIRGKKIVFDISYTSARVEESERDLHPLVLENVTKKEHAWLKKHAMGQVIVDCDYQGMSHDDYELIRNPQNGQVALKWQGMLMIDPLETGARRFYDGLTIEVERLSLALKEHREGLKSGWGDKKIPDSLMPARQTE